MPPLDYHRSFITFVTPGRTNHARIAVEARCRLTAPDGHSTDVYLVASCKSEDTYAAQNLFRQPNYDFCALFTSDRYRILRTPVPHDPAADESGASADRFDDVVFQLREDDTAVVCDDAEQIVVATLAGRPLVARTTLTGPDGRTARLEYPVKTMNVNRDPYRFQVDTGPVPVPLGAGWEGDLDGFALAYVACNAPDWAELVLLAPVDVGGLPVRHYAEVVVCEAANELLAAR